MIASAVHPLSAQTSLAVAGGKGLNLAHLHRTGFAVPPGFIISTTAYQSVDPISSRLGGAALMGIGVASWLERKASAEILRAMLNLKIIWATSAVVGIALGLLHGGPPVGRVLLAIFTAFLALWVHCRLRLR